MAYVPWADWENGPSGRTPITGSALDHIEAGIEAAAAVADNALPTNEPGELITSPDGISAIGVWAAASTITMRQPIRLVTRFQSGHGWTGATADDTSVYLYGTQSYRLTTNGAGTAQFVSSGTFTAQDWSASTVRVVFRLGDPTKITTFQCYLTHGSGNVVQASIQNVAIAGEWYIATIARSQFATASGTPNWANVTQVQFRTIDTGGGTTVHYQAVELVPDQAATYPNGVLVVEFDDGYAGQIANALPVLSARGIPATLNVIVDRFTGTPTSGITPAQLRTLQDKHGWQISCHAYLSSVHNATPATASALEQDFLRSKHWLHANGLHSGVDHLALCPGTGSPVAEGTTLDTIREYFRSVRVNSGFFETYPAGDPLRIRSVLYSGQTNSQINANLDSCAGAGGTYVLAMHDVITGSTNGTSNSLPAIAANNLATVLDYAVTTKGMRARTRADWLDGR